MEINTEPMLLPVKFSVENTIHTLTSSSIAMLYQSWWNSSVVSASKPNVWLFPWFPYANNVCIFLSLICNLNLHRHSQTLHQTHQLIDQTKAGVIAASVAGFISLLGSPHPVVAEQAICTLGNFSGDSHLILR